MPPACKILGPSSTRSLREYLRIYRRSQQLQRSHGSDHRSSADAHGLGAADGYAEKTRAHSHLCSWLRVCAPVYVSRFSGTDVYVRSVCAITIIRLVLSINLNLEDFTYSLAKIGIVTILEPLLGIIIACLPLFPPALKKIGGHMKTDPGTPNVLSSAMARLRSKRSENSTFQRVDDSYPLTELENNTTTHNCITGKSSKQDSLDRDYRGLAGAIAPPESAIMVDVGWEVRSNKAGRVGEKL